MKYISASAEKCYNTSVGKCYIDYKEREIIEISSITKLSIKQIYILAFFSCCTLSCLISYLASVDHMSLTSTHLYQQILKCEYSV